MNLQNLVDFAQFEGIDIFAGVSVPAPLNKDTVKSAIMVRSGLMTPLYLEPEVFKALVTHWFTTKQWTFQHLINIIQAQYSPIENYDRYEDSTRTQNGGSIKTESGTIKDTLSGTDTFQKYGEEKETHAGKDTEAHSGTDSVSHSGTDSTTNYISAENESTFQNDNKSDLLHGESIGTTHGESIDTTHGHTITDSFTNRKDETTYGKTNTRSYTDHKIEDTNNGSDTYTNHMHGNIGIVSNQQMIEQELELLRHFDIYGYIAELFEDDNMLLIY